MLLSYYYGYFDWTYLLVLVGAILSIAASASVKSTFNRYAKVGSASGMTGCEAAQRILQYSGINDVQIERVSGRLTDHYDPRSNVLRLSESTYDSSSVAAIGVAAHECGHAIQHNENYGPLVLRSTIVPLANIGSYLGIPLILLGVFLSYNSMLIQIGIWVFAIAVFLQVVTLPVEINASRRATACLSKFGILGTQELSAVRKVLTAAAMTYVAAAASAILSLLRLIILFGGRRKD